VVGLLWGLGGEAASREDGFYEGDESHLVGCLKGGVFGRWMDRGFGNGGYGSGDLVEI
jgi:hypothetical protein